MIPHAITTLNLLRQSQINPKLSKYAQLRGAFYYNAAPLAPPGTKIIVHEKPAVQGSWATRGINRWYIGGVFDHYRCHKLHVYKTAYTRISNTVEFILHSCRIPYRSLAENAPIAATKLINALKNPAPDALFVNIGDKQIEALKK